MATPGFIEVNYNLCTGCRLCEIACSMAKENAVNPEASRIKVYSYWPGPIDIPAICRSCSHHPCVGACPEKIKALSIDLESGILLVDEERCLGYKCAKCAKACPHQKAISFHPETGKAIVCDLCSGDPACVEACPTGCLTFLPKSTFDGKHYAAFSPDQIAYALALQYHPAKRDIQRNWEEE